MFGVHLGQKARESLSRLLIGSASLPRFGLTGGNVGQEKDALGEWEVRRKKPGILCHFIADFL